jgi:hypothetical protein
MFRYLYHLVYLLSTILVFVFDTTLKEMADGEEREEREEGREGAEGV